jgi:hypothetical protein
MSVSEELMKFRAGLNSSDPDLAVMIKMAAAVIEQIEKEEDRQDRITFTLDEFLRLPWHWELLDGVLVFPVQTLGRREPTQVSRYGRTPTYLTGQAAWTAYAINTRSRLWLSTSVQR